MSKTKYNLEYEIDSLGRKRVDLSDLQAFARQVVYTSGASPVYEIDMAVPSVYEFQFSHSGIARLRLVNIRQDCCVTVNIFIVSAAERMFQVVDDKDGVLGTQYWMEGIMLDTVKAGKSYIIAARNYGSGLNSVMINWIRKG